MSMNTNASFGMNRSGFTTVNNSFGKIPSNFGIISRSGSPLSKTEMTSRRVLQGQSGTTGPTVYDIRREEELQPRCGWMTLIEHLSHPHFHIPDPNNTSDQNPKFV